MKGKKMANESLLGELLKNITDPQMREKYAKIVNGKTVAKIYCKSKTCNGALIGYVYNDGSVVSEDTADKSGNPISGVLSSRDRFDGEKGFSCVCGNSSIIAEQEKGSIGINAPTKRDLETIAENIQNNPANYKEVNGKKIVDGFIIERTQTT